MILNQKVVLGILIWCGIAAVGVIGLRRAHEDAPAASTQIVRHLVSFTRDVQVKFDRLQLLAVNDPVFLSDSGIARPVGRVSRLGSLDESASSVSDATHDSKIDVVDEVTVTLFGDAPDLYGDATFVLQSTPHSTEWVVRTMLPAAKREELVALIVDSYRMHMPVIASAFKPIVQDSISTASAMIKDDLQKAFESREAEFQVLGKRFEAQLLQKKIVPVLQDEVWPIVEKRATPLAKKVGSEIWQELSLWRFGWRFLYDKSPLPERNFTEKEFNRFVREKAAPILKSHIPEMLKLQKDLVEEFADHPKIRKTVRESFQAVINDQQLRDVLTSIFHEVLVDNNRLQQVMQQQWTSEQTRDAIALANRRLDPTINRIGAALFGDPNQSITPEFARVLRRMVLHKDQRWLLLDPGSDEGRENQTGFYRGIEGSDDALIPSSMVPVSLRGNDR